MTYGLLRLPNPPTMVHWGSLPRWLWLKLALSVPGLATSYFVPSAKHRFELRLPWYRYRGYADGWRMRNRSARTSSKQTATRTARRAA
jgi:hypothetical protein